MDPAKFGSIKAEEWTEGWEPGGAEEPDPPETDTEFGRLVAALEGCSATDFNMTTLAYTGSNATLTAFPVGSKMTVANGYGNLTQWINLGYNGSIPEYVKYRRAVGSGWKHVWVKSTGSNGLLRAIAVGDTAYVRTYNSTSKGFDYTAAEGETVTAIDGSFAYGNNATWTVPTSITTAKGTYAFCGYNITLNSEGLLQSLAFDPDASCFLPGTKISMADGTTKNIEDLKYGDDLLVWDFDEGKLGTAKVFWLTLEGLKNDHYYQLTFSDGTVLKTTGRNSNHKVYNVDEKFFKGVDKTAVGDRVYSKNGIVTVTDKQYVEEEVAYYNVMTSKKINCFADGILTSDRYGNLYPITEQMTYNKEGRTIKPYSEFEAVGISEFWYDNLRLGEADEPIEKALDYVKKCEKQMRPIENN